MPLPSWSSSTDSERERPGVKNYFLELAEGQYVAVSQLRAGTEAVPEEWGWTLCDENGFPLRLGTGCASAEEAMNKAEAALQIKFEDSEMRVKP